MIVILASVMLGQHCAAQEEKVGKRPYELDWAGRFEDDHPPLIDFEDLTGWTVETKEAEATFVRTREEQIWGQYVGKLTYRGTGNQPVVMLRPPQPIPIEKPFDAVTIWVYGNNWAWINDPTTPRVLISAVFIDSAGQEFTLPIWTVYWREWFLCHRRLSPDLIERVKGGAKLAAITVSGGRNKDDRVLYFDNFAVFTEEFKPLTLSARPRRGIDMFPGQTVGTNTGPGRLPFPTRKETILPDVLTQEYANRVVRDGDSFVLSYADAKNKFTVTLTPRTGTLGDLTISGGDAQRATWTLRPCVDGGVYFSTDKGAAPPERAEHLGTELVPDRDFADLAPRRGANKIISRWRMHLAERSAEVTYTYRIWGKSLVIDVIAPGGEIAEVRYGHCEGAQNPRLVTLPYYPMGAGGPRPAVLVADTQSAPLFLMGNTCWYLSNASQPFAVNEIRDGKATYNGGVRYIPKTDGKRNDVYERFFVSVSHRFEEVLPTIPNPESPWKHITGTHQWIAHGASNRENDLKHFRETHRYGMTEVVITDHETMWRDGGESFTFRTRTAPGRGGDESQIAYGKALQEELGFVYGPYNNFTDFAPVNEYWSVDRVSRTPDNQLQGAWARCYAPKPTIAVEFCERLSPINQQKFHFSTAYCDVHTAVAPWDRVDYDARVPGAGTFTGVFYPYGEIMLLQKKAWNGPVYSEGNNHAFYCGLTDGNYGQDQRYGLDVNPWLVDFDLRKMHDLCCNFGMGNPEMFYSSGKSLGTTEQEIDASIDRFFCATVAFGHPGFLTYSGGGLRTALRGYYMLQQLHSQYCLSSVDEIRYANAKGELLDTSAAVASGDYRRSQIVTRYKNGCVTACNGSMTERMKVEAYGRKLDLPPNGYAGWMPDGSIEVLSSDNTGTRTDYAVTPAYLFVDGRGTFVRHPKAAGTGIGICRKLGGGKWEYIPFRGAQCGFAVGDGTAVALDFDRKELGPAEVRRARGLTYIMPVEGAFSYVLTEGARKAVELTCDRDVIVPGETVTVQGRQRHEFTAPSDARPGERLWQQFEGAWIDFTVVPLTDTKLSLQGDDLVLEMKSNLSRSLEATVRVGDSRQSVTLRPGETNTARFSLGVPKREDVEVLAIAIEGGPYKQTIETVARTTRGYQRVMEMPTKYTWGIRLRGGEETEDPGETRGYVSAGTPTCGGVSKPALQAHPPYVGGVGYTFVLYEPVKLPETPAAAFRCMVGKADGSDPGDGILYKLEVVEEDGTTRIAGQQLVQKHEWLPLEADLTPWAGRTIRLKIIADVGEADNSVGDWACWAEPRIESRNELLVRALVTDPDRYRRVPGPYPLAGLKVADLRSAKAGFIHYDGCGLSGTGEYGTIAIVNGIEVGEMAPAGGDEVKGVWAENVSVPLTAEAIRTLGRRNVISIGNPRQDWFKVRRFWIELQLADGRRFSSDISTATFTQPPSWPYAEGIGVPHGEEIAVDVWFDVEE